MATREVPFDRALAEFKAESFKMAREVLIRSAIDFVAFASRPRRRGGNMPVDTGFLRGSETWHRTGARPSPRKPTSDQKQRSRLDAGVDTRRPAAARAAFGRADDAEVTWRADYAAEVERGSSTQRPSRMVSLAVMRWKRIIARNLKEVAGA